MTDHPDTMETRKDKIKEKSRSYTVPIFMALAVATLIGGVSVSEAAVIELDQISMTCGVEATLTNGEGETLTIDKNGELSGTMEILEKKITKTMPGSYLLTVRSYPPYTYEKKEKKDSKVTINNLEENKFFVILCLTDTGSASFNFNPEGRVEVQGPRQKYTLVAQLSPNSGTYSLEGTMNEKLTIVDQGNQIAVTGANGKTKVEIEGSTGKPYTEGEYYLFGPNVILGATSKGTYIKEAIKLPKKTAKSIKCLYLRPVNNGKNMALTWRKVKKAKSYVVYKYNEKLGKYRRVAVRKGNGTNYYIAPITDTRIQKYKVAAMSKKNGKGRTIGKLSYEVSSAMPLSSKGNAVRVKVNSPKKVTVKVGKSKKMRARVVSEGKPLYNSSIRWYSSNTRIANIGKKTGKIKAIKKGKCYIWAKAHNGKNSKKIKVIVK